MKNRTGMILFLTIQAILYISFLTVDLIGGSSNLSGGLKFGSILINLCYVLFLAECKDRIQLNLLRTALFFTVISDLLILILDCYFYGVITFIVVQQLYGIRLILLKKQKGDNKRTIIDSWFLRFGLQLLIAVFAGFIIRMTGIRLDGLTMVSVFYFISFVFNVVTAVRFAAFYHEKNSVLFAAGLVLFLLCDINVGLFNLSDFINLSGPAYTLVYSVSSILMWTFYAPSQVLITLSSANKEF